VIQRRLVQVAVWSREIAIPALVIAVLVTASSPANDIYSHAVADATPIVADAPIVAGAKPSIASVPLSGEPLRSSAPLSNEILANKTLANETRLSGEPRPSSEPVVTAAIPATAPAAETTVSDAPARDIAKADASKPDEPKTDVSKTEVSKTDASKTDVSDTGASNGAAAKPDAPGADAPPAKGPQLAALEMPDAKPSQPSLEPTAHPVDVAGPQKEEVYDATSAIEIRDECLVIDMCADRYLWQLYQRTPKEDSIRETRSEKVTKQVTVKKKKKTITVTRTWSVTIDEDFGWKDPKAAKVANMSLADYVIGGVDRNFKLRLFSMLHAADEAGLAPGITSGFRDDYRQSIASGLKAASNRSFHGGSLRGGYGHGLAADIVSVKGSTRGERLANSNILWKWVDDHGSEFGIGRPYLGRDPPHVAPNDGDEFARHRPGAAKTRQAAN
jgi:hypothetical protein